MTTEFLGQVLGKYRVVRVIGEGGMGIVFEGERMDIGGRAAVKLLKKELANNEEVSERFFNEARAASCIEHPTIVRVFDYGTLPDGRYFLAMEYIDGETLSSRLHRMGRLPIPEALRLVRQMAAGLTAAHEKGIVHRDLKPANVMLVADAEVAGGERVKLLDFGIAKLLGDKSKTGLRLMGTDQHFLISRR